MERLTFAQSNLFLKILLRLTLISIYIIVEDIVSNIIFQTKLIIVPELKYSNEFNHLILGHNSVT